MEPGRDLKPVRDLLPALLAGLGVARLDVVLRLSAEWESLVDDPWKSHSVPQILREGVLVVEAKTGAAVRLLRYGSAGLADHLAEEFGADVIHTVEVVAPSRH